MENSKEVVVVIPVHSNAPSLFERISFDQCFRIFNNRDIFLVAPQGLDVSEYRRLQPQLQVKFIHPKWQASKYMYNQLKLSTFFYNLFSGYRFLLTYELDCFAFRDDLDNWCAKDYDYIGAPWFNGFHDAGDEIIGVGNSGFSLRKISTIKKVLRRVYLDDDAVPKQQHALHKAVKYSWLKLMNSFGGNYSIKRLGVQGEDLFFCRTVPRTNPGFNIAPAKDAAAFSFETRPELLFNMNDGGLPTGCHAWWRYNLAFWKPHIEAFGYKL